MTRPARRPYLIGYDIAEPRRLKRLHAFLKDRALPLQYSVFLGVFTPAEVDRTVAAIERRIDPRRDDVRLYPLARRTRIVTIGEAALPDGVFLPGTDEGVSIAFEPYAPARTTGRRWGLVKGRGRAVDD